MLKVTTRANLLLIKELILTFFSQNRKAIPVWALWWRNEQIYLELESCGFTETDDLIPLHWLLSSNQTSRCAVFFRTTSRFLQYNSWNIHDASFPLFSWAHSFFKISEWGRRADWKWRSVDQDSLISFSLSLHLVESVLKTKTHSLIAPPDVQKTTVQMKNKMKQQQSDWRQLPQISTDEQFPLRSQEDYFYHYLKLQKDSDMKH